VAVLLLALPSPCLPSASAGTYTWGPIAGIGYYQAPPLYETVYFTAYDGTLSLNYNYNPGGGGGDLSMEFSLPSVGFDAIAGGAFTATAEGGGVLLSAEYSTGGVISVFAPGALGPVDADGEPMSLTLLTTSPVYVGVSPMYHGLELTFSGQSVPEPSSLLTLALGISAVAVAAAARHVRRRPGIRESRSQTSPSVSRPGQGMRAVGHQMPSPGFSWTAESRSGKADGPRLSGRRQPVLCLF
jgi:hypothetical protein